MATVAKPHTSPPRPAAPAAEPLSAPEVPALDPMRPYFGDRIAFTIWIVCAIFMAALVAFDTILGLFR